MSVEVCPRFTRKILSEIKELRFSGPTIRFAWACDRGKSHNCTKCLRRDANKVNYPDSVSRVQSPSGCDGSGRHTKWRSRLTATPSSDLTAAGLRAVCHDGAKSHSARQSSFQFFSVPWLLPPLHRPWMKSSRVCWTTNAKSCWQKERAHSRSAPIFLLFSAQQILTLGLFL